ncbi:hypothetical protein CLV71_101249 [Actinophytocola oryzae]|uniref:Uncharacterized protein n=1 Tax=Actinophytocola oryzae TaxID=502181 RepID=A0A4R7W5J4_9PSEU|nr:hypothetical protein CLV71_101249 [Actinophytocola oryzae]
MPDQGVMTTPIFDELLAELGHDLGHLEEPDAQDTDSE